ncbi:hypothetical protein BIFGAL_04116 [Bifidobacterium gallicum DSM 20093 = LMG 11596]|uniref:Uncharacterized protein n=1 Tax=Bifidobacterium gallicum DSM 20093 = LMG 11596 TaxID=561180 RepID=D1NW69_9BIFI|nr:hypothetical protein BIFGAL_04116 [Bifidobacterium gallicum DSM 20093 = LMG 11596]
MAPENGSHTISFLLQVVAADAGYVMAGKCACRNGMMNITPGCSMELWSNSVVDALYSLH